VLADAPHPGLHLQCPVMILMRVEMRLRVCVCATRGQLSLKRGGSRFLGAWRGAAAVKKDLTLFCGLMPRRWWCLRRVVLAYRAAPHMMSYAINMR
jgi:hypothetical protein